MTPTGDLNNYKSETNIRIRSDIYIYIYICHLGDLNKYMSDTNISINIYPTGDKYQSDRSSSICPLGDMNMYKI